MNGILHTVYYVLHSWEKTPLPGSETIYPTVAECRAMNENAFVEGSDPWIVASWTPSPTTPLFSQRDIRWKDAPLGGPPLQGGRQTTIGEYGCVVTSLAMGLSRLTGEEIYPTEVSEALSAVNGFGGVNQNMVFWGKVPEAFPYVKQSYYLVCEKDPAPTEEIDKLVANGDIVLFKIDYDLTTPKVDSHYLLAIRGEGDDRYVCHDSWLLSKDQRPIELPPAYCKQDWDAARAIFAVVAFGEA